MLNQVLYDALAKLFNDDIVVVNEGQQARMGTRVEGAADERGDAAFEDGDCRYCRDAGRIEVLRGNQPETFA